MNKNFVFSLFCFLSFHASAEIDNGIEASSNQFPAVVRISYSKMIQGNETFLKDETCSGVLIDSSVVLTAAHCISRNSKVIHRVSFPGDGNGTTNGTGLVYKDTKGLKANNYFIHPDYELTDKKHEDLQAKFSKSYFRKLSNEDQNNLIKEDQTLFETLISQDLAILTLQKKFEFYNEAAILYPEINCNKLPTGSEVMIAGYGARRLIDQGSEYDSNRGNKLNYGYNTLTTPLHDGLYRINRVTGKQMIDVGDSGGPLFLKNDMKYLYGISSMTKSNGYMVNSGYFAPFSSSTAKKFFIRLIVENRLPNSLSASLMKCVK